jgi:FkbM family methyltransferase
VTPTGESALQRWVLGLGPDGELHVADVGANVGRWSQSLLAAAPAAGREADVRLHAFEPDAGAYARLERALDGAPAMLSVVALSDRLGTSRFHTVAPIAGINSLHPAPGTTATAGVVSRITLDSYAARSGVPHFNPAVAERLPVVPWWKTG